MKNYFEAKVFVSISGTTLVSIDLEEGLEDILEQIDEVIAKNYSSSFERVDFEIDDDNSFSVYYEFRVSGIHYHLDATLLDPPEDEIEFYEEFDNLDKILNEHLKNIKFVIKESDNYEII